MEDCSNQVNRLVARGARVPCPEQVWIAPEVDLECLATDVTLYPGCRLGGAETSIGPGSELGGEGPVVLTDCQLGADVVLKAGSFSGATFLDGVALGPGAHVRPGTLLEEQVECGHCVGFKQTLLMPYVVTGSLVNLCDCLMAGGTSRRNHSEVGSSFVHFNYTPHQDKATASLFGDVPHGVLLNQPPIFLGGQGGVVGPCRLAYGTVLAAGSICRHDVLRPNRLVTGGGQAVSEKPYAAAVRGDVTRVLMNNFWYIGNLHALAAWYRLVRKTHLCGSRWGAVCWRGAMERLNEMRSERVRRLSQLVAGLDAGAAESPLQKRCVQAWPGVEEHLAAEPPGTVAAAARDAFLAGWEGSEAPYLEAVAGLSDAARAHAVGWLQAVVDAAAAAWEWSV